MLVFCILPKIKAKGSYLNEKDKALTLTGGSYFSPAR